MADTIQKPSFREENGIIHLDDVGLSFNAQMVGPMNFYDLRKAYHKRGFRMSTMPELVHLVYASLENQDYASAKNVIETLKNHFLTGNTGIIYPHGGIYVQDKPKVRNGKIFMNPKTLQNKLGPHEEKGVVFSDDRSVRFIPYNSKKDTIALVGGEENEERLVKVISERFSVTYPRFEIGDINSPEAVVAGFASNDYLGGIYAHISKVDVDHINRISFGVKELKD